MSAPDDALPEIGVDEAIALVAQGTPLLDVREQHEWDAGHAPDARLLPMSELEQRIPELPAGEQFLVVCHSGARSARVTAWLVNQGYDAVNVDGGMMAWRAAGGRIEPQGPGAPGA